MDIADRIRDEGKMVDRAVAHGGKTDILKSAAILRRLATELEAIARDWDSTVGEKAS